jgi:hypothetical protein
MISAGRPVLELRKGTYKVIVDNDEGYDARSPVNLHSYAKEYPLSEGSGYRPSSKHTVTIRSEGSVIGSCIVTADGGATGIHRHSALICGNSCILAVGQFMCSLHIPSLDLKWRVEADYATCFGVYYSAKHNCFISHGELTIARVEPGGKMAWSSGGKDIFTGILELFDDYVEVTDFNDERYRFDIATGEEC